MGIIRGAMKTGIAMKALQMAKQQMDKPENRAKAKAAFDRFQDSRRTRKAR